MFAASKVNSSDNFKDITQFVSYRLKKGQGICSRRELEEI
jgi:hypothetical protein